MLWIAMMLHGTRAMKWEDHIVRMKGGEIAEKCDVVVTFRSKKKTKR